MQLFFFVYGYMARILLYCTDCVLLAAWRAFAYWLCPRFCFFFFVGGVFSLLQSRSNALGVIYLYMVVATAHLKRGGGQIFFRWERERYRGWWLDSYVKALLRFFFCAFNAWFIAYNSMGKLLILASYKWWRKYRKNFPNICKYTESTI